MSLDLLAHLKEGSLRSPEQNCREFEALREEWADAWRNRRYERADQLSAEMVPYLFPKNPAVNIIGGFGGYALVREDLFPTVSEFSVLVARTGRPATT